jgi:hypothetical protein
MDILESDLLLLLGASIAAIRVLFGAFVIAARVNRAREQLGELAALQTSIQAIETDFAQIVKIVGPMSDTLPSLAGLGLHFRQIKRDQFCLSKKLKTISSAVEEVRELLDRREESKSEQGEEIKELVNAYRALEEWKSGVVGVCADASHLFESEPVLELIDSIGPQAASSAG